MKKYLNRKRSIAKTLGLLSLMLFGISTSFGIGSYCLIGFAAQYAGPAISISILIIGVLCLFAGLPYIEFATSIPSTGFSYKFIQISWGEYIGFIFGFILTFLVTCVISLQARGFSIAVIGVLEAIGIHIPEYLYSINLIPGLNINLMPIFLIIPLTIIACREKKESTKFNYFVAFINISVLIIALVAGLFYIEFDHFENYFSKGISGIFKAGGIVYVMFCGFEQVTNFSDESLNVERDVPIAILFVISMQIVINGGLSFVMIGMAPLSAMNNEKGLSSVFEYRAYTLFSSIISFGSIISLISVTFSNILNQTQIYYTMAKDGMIPQQFCERNKAQALYKAAYLTCIISLAVSILFRVEFLSNLIGIAASYITTFVILGLILHRHRDSSHALNIGIANVLFVIVATFLGYAIQRGIPLSLLFLFACILVLIYFYIKHFKEDKCQERSFECPFVPEVPLIGAFGFSLIAGSSPINSLLFFGIISSAGFILYFLYGYSHSKVSMED